MNFNHDIGLIDGLLQIDTTTPPPLGGIANSLKIFGTGSLFIPSGTTAERPVAGAAQIRYNTDLGRVEVNDGTAWLAQSSTTGTVTSIALVAGNTSVIVSGSPITSSGTINITLNNELNALAALATTGLVSRTAAGTYTSRTLTGTALNISVVNGDGIGGNPVIDLINAGTPVTSSFVKITTDVKGRVISTTPVIAADITGLVDGSYVNVSGDTMQSGATLTFIGGGEVQGLPIVPLTAGSAVSKAYVDSLLQGLNPKPIVTAATTAPGTLATSFAAGSVHDGVTLTTGMRFLIKNQTTQSENGIFTINASGAPTRATDMDIWTEFPGAHAFVEKGTTQADTGWLCISDFGGIVGTSNVMFQQFTGPGTYSAGNGLLLTGNQFSLVSPVTLANGGTGLTAAPSNGQLLIGNGTSYSLATLTPGSGIGIANAAGTITLTNTGITSVIGTANQVTAVTNAGSTTLSLPSTLVIPGSLGITTNLTVSGLTSNSFMYSGPAGLVITTAAPTNGQILIGSTGSAPVSATLTAGSGINIINGSGTITISTINAGTVTSVAASGGTTGLTFAGSPISTSGILTLGGTLAATSGGTGLSSLGTSNQTLGVNPSGTALEYKTVGAGAGISVAHGAGVITIAATNTGTVTSIGLAAPAMFTVTNSPITTTGTLTLTLATQASGTVFAGPATGVSVAPSFRQLAFTDLTVNAIKLYNETPSTPVAPIATGANSVALGSGASATGVGSMAIGLGASATLYGEKAFANGSFATLGDAQGASYVLRNITTTSTITELFLDGVTATQRLVMPNNSLWTFSILISGRRTDAVGGGAGYRIDGVARKDATSASISLIGAVTKAILGETNAAWDTTVTIDTTTGALRVQVTGENAKTIRWVAVVNTSEITN